MRNNRNEDNLASIRAWVREEQLANLRERMFTPTGRRIAQERHRVMVAFFERLEREVSGQA